ncbi:hypothetical protein SLL00_03475 [Metabacillus indicus]|uniref:hypothetical protein n=1 Tax=Metabacillus indicus TaxID=246786 RepID=UPI002A07482B|nr:hypothetical protein [Metabacillus indicus]MDX8288834.1 hypothetical protein [Metabacillus indicus]
MTKPKYEALIKFKDKQDDSKVYEKGDRFPKPANKKIEDERIQELLSSDNKAGKPVIKEI